MKNQPNITLAPLQPDDREQFIRDNQWAFKYDATEEFGLRDDHYEEDGEIISRATIENSIDGENAEAYRILLDDRKVGGVVLRIDKEKAEGELELLFVNRCGFHIVEFWNKHHHGPSIPDEEVGNWSEGDEMFVFRKVIE